MSISLSEVAQRIEKAGTDATQRVDDVLARTAKANDAMTALGATMKSLQARSSEALPALASDVGSLRSELEKARSDFDAGFAEVSGRVADLKQQLGDAAATVDERFKGLNQVTAALTAEVGEVETYLSETQAQQRSIIESGLARVAEEQQVMKKAVQQAANDLAKLQKGLEQARASEASQVGQLVDVLNAGLTTLKTDLATLDSEGTRAVSEFEGLLGALLTETLRPALLRIEQRQQQSLEGVEKRAREAVRHLDDDGVVRMADQARSTEVRLTEKQRPLDQAAKTLRDGPQLRPLLVASRDVLKRIGKIALLGPLAQGI